MDSLDAREVPGTEGPAIAPDEFVDALAAAVSGAFAFEARRGMTLPVPREGYDRKRGQFEAESFLQVLAAAHENGGARRRGPGGQGLTPLLGVTGRDIFVPRLNFVFGLAAPQDALAVVSLHRLAPEFYGEAADPELLLQRAVKESVHELGHIFGLTHCDQPRCIMRFSNAIGDTDEKGPGFCGSCAAGLEQM